MLRAKFHPIYFLFFLILLFRVQAFHNLPQDHIVDHILSNKKVTLIGRIVIPPEKFNKKTRLLIESEELTLAGKTIKVSGKVRITAYDSEILYKYGDRIRIDGIRLRRPRNFKNEGAFDYEAYMKNRGIYVTGSIGKRSKIELIDQDNGYWILKLVYQFKENMMDSLEKSLTRDNSGILKAMVLGNKGALTKKDQELFIRSGTAHLMAVSGLHIGFVVFVSYWSIKRITGYIMTSFFMEKALSGWIIPLSALLAIIPLILYMTLVGWKASSMRAGIMVIVYLFAIALSRQREIFRSIIIAAFIILLWNPLSFLEVGFQLSFMAILTIIFCYRELIMKKEVMKDIPVKKNKIMKMIQGNIIVNLFAVIGTTPLILYYFNRITPYGFFANIIAVPLAALIIPGTIISMIIYPVFHPAGVLGFKIVSFLTSVLMLVIEFFSELPMASLRFATPPLLAIIAFYLFGFFMVKLRKQRQLKWISIAAGLILLVSLLINYLPLSKNQNLKVTFLDVGQGDATLIQLPDGKTMLIDGGGLYGDFDIGENVVAPYLWDYGLEKIDYIIPTHSDNDHIGGLFYVLKEMKAGMLWTNSLIPFETKINRLENLAREKGVSVIANPSIQIWDRGNFNIKIEKLHPTKEFASYYFGGKENNYSTVLKISYGLISFLFASDIEKESEDFLVKKYGSKLRSTILKVPHHGSKTSSTNNFIDSVKPDIAVISAGAWNRFNHPAKKVIGSYEKSRIKIYRTDLDGAITITTDGLEYEIKTFIKR